MFLQTVPENLKSNLESLGQTGTVEQFYLAGGTALSLQLGHRISNDLDFFTDVDFSARPLITMLEQHGDLSIETRAKQTVLGKLNRVRISFFYYKYPLLFLPVSFMGIHIADIRDIGAMKLDAIQGRGKKRDFIDLFTLLQKGVSLKELFSHFEKKYEGVNYNKQHLLKSLTYFTDAEKDEMPQMINTVSWEEVKKYIESEAKKFVGNHAGF